MYYFDNEYLKQYLNLGKEVKVTITSGDVLTLTDESDVEDSQQCSAQDENGNSSFFDYMDIEQIQVGPMIMTLDTLQKVMADNPEDVKEPEKEKPASPPKDEEPPPEEEPKDEKPEKGLEKASYDIYMLGRDLINESRKIKR